MHRIVYTSARKLLIVSSPLLVIAIFLTGLAFWRTDFILFALMADAVAIALVARLFPLGKPILELTSVELRYGPGLREVVKLQDVKHASIYSSPHAWPGSVCVSLSMEAQLGEGQTRYPQRAFTLFCPDMPAKELGECINRFLEGAKHR